MVVFFVDFGNTAHCRNDELLQLPSELFSIPSLAIHCCLYGVSVLLLQPLRDTSFHRCCQRYSDGCRVSVVWLLFVFASFNSRPKLYDVFTVLGLLDGFSVMCIL